MVGRFVARAAEKHGMHTLFAHVGPESETPMLTGDLVVGNLESPLTGREGPLRPGPYRLPAPPGIAPVLREAGFDLLSLANNHTLDVGPPGLRDTHAALVATGIAATGAGPDATTAYSLTIRRINGLSLALFGFNDVADPQDTPDEGENWGRAWLNETALEAVHSVRSRVDVVIVLVHWGCEYDPHPTPRQREWGRRLVAAGADLVLGSHPHIIQPVEIVDVAIDIDVVGDEKPRFLTSATRRGVVAYSLGNFLFDQPYDPETSAGLVLRVLLDSKGVAKVEGAGVGMVAMQVRPLPAPPAPRLAWVWDGEKATPLYVPPDTPILPRPDRLPADLRGNGEPLWGTLNEQGVVEVRDGTGPDAPLVWHNEAADWRITRLVAGDPNDDGRIEFVLLLWKPDDEGILRSHPFIMGWRGGHYRIIWGGSATTTPIQDLALTDVEHDGEHELVVLEGGRRPDDIATTVSVWRWHGWGFQLEWRSPPGRWNTLALDDLTGDGHVEIITALLPAPR